MLVQQATPDTTNQQPRDTPATGRRAEAAVLALSAATRLAWALVVPVVPVSDCTAYDTFARNLATANTFGWEVGKPSAYWPVGAPFMYSLLYRVFPPDRFGFSPAVALNLALGVLMVGLSMALCARWFGRRVGLVAGLLLALWPMHVEFTTVIASETIFTVLCLGALLAWPARGQWATWRLLLTGLLFAAASYVRPTALLIPVPLAVAEFFLHAGVFTTIRRLVLIYAAMTVAILPWTLRNFELFHHAVLISTNGGPNLWMGNNPDTTGFYMPEPPMPPGANEAEYHAQLGQQAVDYIKAHPAAFVARSAVKAVRLYERETIGVAWNIEGLGRVAPPAVIRATKIAGQGFYMAALAASLAGAGLLLRRLGPWRGLLHPALVLIAYFTAVHAVIVIQDRYHFPITPVMAGLAALAIVYAIDLARARRDTLTAA